MDTDAPTLSATDRLDEIALHTSARVLGLTDSKFIERLALKGRDNSQLCRDVLEIVTTGLVELHNHLLGLRPGEEEVDVARVLRHLPRLFPDKVDHRLAELAAEYLESK